MAFQTPPGSQASSRGQAKDAALLSSRDADLLDLEETKPCALVLASPERAKPLAAPRRSCLPVSQVPFLSVQGGPQSVLHTALPVKDFPSPYLLRSPLSGVATTQHPLLLLPPIPPSIRVFSKESTLHMRWPKYWSLSFRQPTPVFLPGESQGRGCRPWGHTESDTTEVT